MQLNFYKVNKEPKVKGGVYLFSPRMPLKINLETISAFAWMNNFECCSEISDQLITHNCWSSEDAAIDL